MKKYSIILADPPWTFKDKAKAGDRGAGCKYDLMTLDRIKALDVPAITADNCALFLWIPDSLLPDGLALGEAWVFEYVTKVFVWIKLTKTGKPFFGMGHTTRMGTESMYFFRRGKMKRVSAGVRQVQSLVVGAHSQKPAIFHALIEDLFGDLPRLEMFARRKDHLGWDCWGNEIDSDIEIKERLGVKGPHCVNCMIRDEVIADLIKEKENQKTSIINQQKLIDELTGR